jgi:SulP family sulfate permease
MKPKILILRLRYVPFIDATGIKRLKEVIRDFRKKKVRVILSGVRSSIQEDFEKTGVYDVISREQVFSNITEAVAKAKEFAAQNRPGD